MERDGGATRAAQSPCPEPLPPVLVFRVGGSRFATEVGSVREVVALCEVVRLGFLPEFFEGVVHLRETLIPVIDLDKRFGTEAPQHRKRRRILLVGIEGRILGAIVDEVFQVLHLDEIAVLPPPPLADGVSLKFLKGVFQHEGQAVFLLDLAELLTGREKTIFRELIPSAMTGEGSGSPEESGRA